MYMVQLLARGHPYPPSPYRQVRRAAAATTVTTAVGVFDVGPAAAAMRGATLEAPLCESCIAPREMAATTK